MATNTGVKFYKFSSSTTSASKIASAKAVEGAIIYIIDANELWIGGATPKLVLKGANDVSYSNNVLTVTHYSNDGGTLVPTTQTLDFSDVASADATLKVFNNVYGLMGASDGTGADAGKKVLDYSGTNYLADLGTTGHPDKNLVNADKALDAAIDGIADTIAAMDAIADADTASGTGYATITTTTPTADFKVLNSITETDGVLTSGEAYQLKKVAATAEAEDLAKSTNSTATYDTTATEISSTWITVVNSNGLADGDTVDADLNKLDTKIAGLADELIRDEQVINATVNTLADSIGLESDLSLDLSDANLTVIKDDTSVKEALEDLDAAFATAGKVDDVKINNTTIVSNKIADIAVDGTYNASTNKIASESTVKSAIDAISGAGLEVDNTGAVTVTTQAISDDSTKIATTAFVHDMVEDLDGSATIASKTGDVVTIKTGVTETDGKISNDSGTDIVLEEVAVTGAAADVSIADAHGKITATNVEDALTELATSIEGLVGGMRYNGDIASATATLNTTTNDIRPGDIYLASDAFSIGTTSVEAGDMIVYKGITSSSAVALTNSNCTIIERETDTMVTAGDTLSDNYLVFGDGNKEVTVTSTVDAANYQVSASDLKTAITNANSALQSISKGTDGTYVTTTIGSKTNNDQTVGVAVTQSTVTYTAASDPDPATLTATNGLLDESAITPIKNYVDAKVGTAVQSVDGSTAEKAKSVTQSTYAAVKVTATTDANNNVTLDSAVGLTVQAVSSADSSHMGLAEASDVKSYVDGEIADLDGSATIASVSNNVVTIKTGVTEADGIISNTTGTTDIVLEEVAVTGAAADVSYNNTASGMTATTVQAAIDELKSGLCWEEYE